MGLLLVCLPFFAFCFGSLVVQTHEGAVQGKKLLLPDGSFSLAWLGIPYAESTASDKRWTFSVPKQPWKGILNTQQFGSGCPQNCILPPGTCPQSMSEDCLSLNVYAPSNATSPLPVMVFFPGGRFEQGASDTYLYDGRFLVQKGNFVIVTVNYRLGALGFLYTDDGATGNFGVQDQVLALKWVQRNIAGFGGDNTRVTIDGQSAGGASVTYHMLSPLSKGLFHQAIIQSNPFSLPFKSRKDGQELGKKFSQALNCKDINCMRKASVAEILEAQHEAQGHFYPLRPLDIFLPWTPMVGTGDPSSLADQPLSMFIHNQVSSPVPLIIGVVANETMIFVYQGLGANPSLDLYYAFLGDVFGIHAAEVFKQYPPHENNRTILHTLSLLGTDFIMACPARRVASASQGYLYYFDHVFSFSKQAWGSNYTECYNLTCHGEELPFIFGSAGLVLHPSYTPAEIGLVSDMQNAWISFVTGSKPWPQFSNATQTARFFSTPSSIAAFPRQSKCDFFDSIGYGRAGRFMERLNLFLKK